MHNFQILQEIRFTVDRSKIKIIRRHKDQYKMHQSWLMPGLTWEQTDKDSSNLEVTRCKSVGVWQMHRAHLFYLKFCTATNATKTAERSVSNIDLLPTGFTFFSNKNWCRKWRHCCSNKQGSFIGEVLSAASEAGDWNEDNGHQPHTILYLHV